MCDVLGNLQLEIDCLEISSERLSTKVEAGAQLNPAAIPRNAADVKREIEVVQMCLISEGLWLQLN